MVQPPLDFPTLLNQYVTRTLYTTGQLAELTSIPQRTIANWLQGRVQRPRQINDLLQIAAALHLTTTEASKLLLATGHPPLPILHQQRPDDPLLDPWQPEYPTPFQVGPQLPYFTGRQAEINTALDALIAQPPQWCIIHGMGGVGKTTLATHLTYQLRAHFTDGILWASPTHTNPLTVLHGFAAAFGHTVNHLTDLTSRAHAVRSLLADKRILIIFDDVWHAADLEPLLPPTGTAAVLITTRRRNLPLSQTAITIPLQPLPRADAHTLTNQLLPHHTPTPTQLTRLTDRLGHLPLALTIATSRLTHESLWTIDQFLTDLEQRLLPTLNTPEASITTTIQLSHDALTAEQQQSFAALSLYKGNSFTPESAAALTPPDHLRTLFTLSLLQTAKHHYQFHPLIHHFAQEQLAQLPTDLRQEQERRFATYFLDFLGSNHYDYKTLEHEDAHFTAAIHIALSHPSLYTRLADPADTYLHYLRTRGRIVHAAELATLLVETARTSDNPFFGATILKTRSFLLYNEGQHQTAAAILNEGFTYAQALNDPHLITSYHRAICEMIYAFDPATRAHSQQHLHTYLQTKQSTIESVYAHNVLGHLASENNCYGEARRHYQQGLTISQELQATSPQIRKLDSLLRLHLGRTELRAGNLGRAAILLNQAHTIAEEFGYPPNIATAYYYKSLLAALQGNQQSAQQHGHEALRLYKQLNYQSAINHLTKHLSTLQPSSVK